MNAFQSLTRWLSLFVGHKSGTAAGRRRLSPNKHDGSDPCAAAREAVLATPFALRWKQWDDPKCTGCKLLPCNGHFYPCCIRMTPAAARRETRRRGGASYFPPHEFRYEYLLGLQRGCPEPTSLTFRARRSEPHNHTALAACHA